MNSDESSSDLLFTYASEVRNCTRRVLLQQLRTECDVVDAQLPKEAQSVELNSYEYHPGLPLKDFEFDNFNVQMRKNEKQAELNELLRVELQQNMKLDSYLNLAQRAGMAFQQVVLQRNDAAPVAAPDDFEEIDRCGQLIDEIDQLSQQVKSRMLGVADDENDEVFATQQNSTGEMAFADL